MTDNDVTTNLTPDTDAGVSIPSTNTSASDKSYETAVNELEQILAQLESANLPLEQAIKQFESGVALIKHCQNILDNTEQQIKGL